MLAFGIGICRDSPINADLRYLFAAGRAWLEGRNPYVLTDLIAATPTWLNIDFAKLHFGFAYPPQASVLCIFLALLGWGAASAAMVLINVTAVVALAWACSRLALLSAAQAGSPPIRDRQAQRAVRWMVPALIVGNPFTQHVLFMGQTSLIAVALLGWGWYLAYAKQSIWLAGLLIGATTFKPQLAALPILFLLLEGRLRLVAIAVLTSLLLAAPGLWLNGPLVSIRTWLEAVALYQGGEFQLASFRHVFGIQSLLFSAGVHIPSLVPLALATVVALRLRGQNLAPGETLGLIAASSILFTFAHDYDLIALAPLFAVLWMRTRGSTILGLAYLLGLASLFIPQRLVPGSVPAPMLHWRECITVGLALWLLISARAERVSQSRLAETGVSG